MQSSTQVPSRHSRSPRHWPLLQSQLSSPGVQAGSPSPGLPGRFWNLGVLEPCPGQFVIRFPVPLRRLLYHVVR